MCNKSETINTAIAGMTEIDLNDQDNNNNDHETSSIHTDDNDDYYFTSYCEIRRLISVPYADPQEESSTIKRKPSEPLCGQPAAIWAFVLAFLAMVFGILAGILTEMSNDDRLLLSLQDNENAIFYAQMFGGTSMVLSLVAIRVLAGVAGEHQLKRLSLGKPMYQKAAWISCVIGTFYSLCILVASFLVERAGSPCWVYIAVPINFLPFVLMMIHTEAARKH